MCVSSVVSPSVSPAVYCRKRSDILEAAPNIVANEVALVYSGEKIAKRDAIG